MEMLLPAILSVSLAGAEPESARWLTDYRHALDVARAEGKPLFIVFRCEH